jgi:hypothetical protein
MLPYLRAEQSSGDRRSGSPGDSSRSQSRDHKESWVMTGGIAGQVGRTGSPSPGSGNPAEAGDPGSTG